MARILGLDVDTHALRGAVVRTSFRKVEIERFVQVPLAPSGDDEERRRAIQQAVTQLSSALPESPNGMAMAFDGRHVSLRRISLPKAAEKRAAEVLTFELESLLPFDSEDAVIDHQVVHSDDKTLDLLAAAALQTHVETALTDLHEAGLDPRTLCPAPLYLEDLSSHLQIPEACIMIELRPQETLVALIDQGYCQAARTLSESLGSDSTGTDAFLRALQMTVASFRASGGPSPKRIVLVGPGAEVPGLTEMLTERLRLPTAIASLPSAGGAHAGPEFARALGLALRSASPGKRINFRSGRFMHQEAGAQWSKHANLAITCAIAILVSFMFSLKAEQSMLLDEQATLQAQLADTTKAVFGRTASTVGSAELLMRNPAGNDPLPRFDALDAMEVVSQSVDKDIKHEVRRLRVEIGDEKHDGRLELQGMVSSIEERDAIASKLEKHPCFSELEKGKTTSVRGQDTISYQLEAAIQCPGARSGKKKKTGSAQ